MRYPTEADVEDLELSAWPGMATAHRGAWLLRMSRGFTSRANSAVALVDGADLDDRELEAVEALFVRHRLPPVIRISCRVATGLDARLAAKGYATMTPSENRVAELTDRDRVDADVAVAEDLPEGWIEDFRRCNDRPDFDAAAMSAMLANIVPPAIYARIGAGGAASAVGMGVIDRGVVVFQSVAVNPALRGGGIGAKLMRSLMAAARARGAGMAALSVNDGNEAARRLYRSLGFETIGRYHYRTRRTTG